MRRRPFFLALGCLCLGVLSSPLPVVGAEYLVSTGGQDTSDGTEKERAFATIIKGVSVLKGGDVLTILPGEYLEAVEMRKVVGTRQEPVVIRAQRAGTVLLRGDVEVTGWEPAATATGAGA